MEQHLKFSLNRRHTADAIRICVSVGLLGDSGMHLSRHTGVFKKAHSPSLLRNSCTRTLGFHITTLDGTYKFLFSEERRTWGTYLESLGRSFPK